MGFGYIFIGVALTANVVANSFTDAIAYLLILMGMQILKDYGSRLKQAYLAAFPLLLVGLFEFALNVLDFLNIFSSVQLRETAGLINQIVYFIFTMLLLRGLRVLAKETETFSIETRVFRNQIFAVIYHVPMIFCYLPIEQSTILSIKNHIFFPFLVFGCIYLILQAKLIYSFYMWICPEGDEDMERKQSKLPFLNKLYNFSEKIDEKTIQRKKEARDAKKMRKENQRKKKHTRM